MCVGVFIPCGTRKSRAFARLFLNIGSEVIGSPERIVIIFISFPRPLNKAIAKKYVKQLHLYGILKCNY